MEKAILITGANGFIGRQLIEFYQGKCAILAIDSNEEIRKLEEQKKQIYCFQCDLSNQNDMENILTIVKEQDLLLKSVIIAHGSIAYGKLEETGQQSFQKIMDSNLTSVFHIIKKLIPVFVENNGGSIVALASQYGTVASYDLISYCTAKAALIQFIRCVALDYADCGIVANTVSPGILESTMKTEINSQQQNLNVNWKLMTSRLPIQNIRSEDIISLIDYLLTQKSITGNNILIDGGYTIR